MRINLRLNPKSDKDIIDALDNNKNLSRAVRELLRQGISGGVHNSIKTLKPTPTKQNNITEATMDKETLDKLKENLLSNFGF